MSKRTLGVVLIVTGTLTPLIGYFAALAYVNSVPQVPPNQGRVVEGLGFFYLSIVVSGVIAFLGLLKLR
jgi:hypothetical protein